VLTSSDTGHGEVRELFNAMHDNRPALAVRCSGTADVVRAVNFARKPAMATGVLGGGHSIDGLSSVQGGMLIDLSPMTDVRIDPEQRLARVQGGALWADVDRETQAFGLVTPGGVVSETGVAGLTLRGGHGWISRKHGLSCDNVVEAEVVCADGQVRTASADSNADLYWAIRGGGGNFGIVTSLTFQLHAMGSTVAFARTFYPIEEVADVLRGWRAHVTEAPEAVTSMCATITFPADPEMPEAVHDRAVAMIGAVYAGDPDEGMSKLQPLRELGTPLADLSEPMPFTAVQTAFDPLFPRRRLQAYWKSQYLNELSDEAIELIAAKALDRPAPLTMVNTFHLGGAIATVRAEDTAFAERSASFKVSIDGMWMDPVDNADRIAWVRSAWREIGEFRTSTDEDSDSPFGRNLRQLAVVKAIYDPDNFFSMNDNIAPAIPP
jgi:FAD/FMN-containing dehydrogenase